MALDRGGPCAEASLLNPAPRKVPLRLRCHLLAGPVALGGSAAFAFGMLFALTFGGATDPVGTWRLARRAEPARGWIDGVEATSFHEGGGEDEEGTPIYRYDFHFELPDGARVRGRCYTVGQQFQVPREASVPVEYDPQHPDTSRIQGTRTSPYTPWVLLILLFPGIAFLVALGGLRGGHRRARLLRDGEPAAATVTACRFGCGEDETNLPVAEYKRRTAEQRARAVGHPVVLVAGAFLHVWTLTATAILVFGVLFCVAALGFLLVVPTPPRERAAFALGIGGFLVAWLLMGGLMVRTGRQRCRALRRRGAGPDGSPAVGCTFEFRLPDGRTVQARAPGRLTESAEEPPQPALYDPARPDRALLLSGLGPVVRVGPSGDWETEAGPGAVLRLLGVVLLLAGPVVAAVFLR